MKILDTCRQITDTESGRVLLYRDEVEAVLTAGDTISRRQAIAVIDAVFPVDPMKSEYTQGIACGAALAKTYVEQLPSARPEQRWIPCGKCIHADGRHRRCKVLDRSINEDYFCYWAERI